jgi:hypothetical protein
VPELQRLHPGHAPAVLAFELAYFAAFISELGYRVAQHAAERRGDRRTPRIRHLPSSTRKCTSDRARWLRSGGQSRGAAERTATHCPVPGQCPLGDDQRIVVEPGQGAVCAAIAAAGVLVLMRPQPTTDYLGLGLDLLAALCWAAYILLNRVIGQRITGAQVTAAAFGISSALYLPIGVAIFARHPPTAAAFGCAIAAGILSSAQPYARAGPVLDAGIRVEGSFRA